jgi:hypothetical protein
VVGALEFRGGWLLTRGNPSADCLPVGPKPLPEISRAEFLPEVREGRVRKVVIEDRQGIIGASTTRGPFRAAFHDREDAALVTELRAMGVEVAFEESGPGLI